MPLRVLRPAVCLFLVLCALVHPAVAAGWPPASAGLAPDPAIRFGTLPNGLRYAIKPNAEPRGRTVLRLLVLTGSLHERDDERGLAHFVEHMAFNGTRLYPKETLMTSLQRHGFAFGPDVSAFTFFTHTIYGIEAPSTGEGRLEEAFGVLREFADGQTFDPEEVERERGVIASERRARDNWQSRAGDDISNFLFKRSLIAQRNPIGLEPIINQVSAAQLRAFYTRWYRPDNLVVIAVGDAPPEKLEALIAEKFATMPAATTPLPKPPDLDRLGNESKARALLHSTGETGAVSIQLNSIIAGPGGTETLASRSAAIRRDLVMDMLNERLDQLRRTNSHDFGEASAQSSAFGQVYSQNILTVTTAPPTWARAVEAVTIEWNRVVKQGFTADEITEAIQRLRRRQEYALAAEATESSAYAADRVAMALAQNYIPTSMAQFQAQTEAILASFDRTVAQSTFNQLWTPGEPALLGIGNLRLPKPEKSLLEARRTALGAKLPPPPKPAISDLAYPPAAQPGTIKSRHHIEDLDIHVIEFANGARANLKATRFSRNLVQFRARVGRGLLALPPRLAGLNLIASNYLIDAGLARHDGDDLRRFIAQRNLGLGFGVAEDAFVFSGGSDTRGLSDLLTLLKAYIEDPAWRIGDYQAAQIRTSLAYSQASREADAALNATAARVMSKDNPLFSLPPADTVGRRTFEEFTTWLGNGLTDTAVEIGLVGDFDVEAAIDLLARTIGTAPARPPHTPPPAYATRIEFYGTPGRWQNVVNSDIPRAAVRVQWLVHGCSDVHNLRRLEALSEVLENRVMLEIREKLGSTYDPSANVWNGETLRDDGYFMIGLTAPPAAALTLAKRIRELAADLAQNGLTADELEAVRQPILSGNDARLRDNSYWLYHVLQALQEEPGRLEWPRSRESDYRAMTVAELNDLAKKYLTAAQAQTFVAVPQSAPPAKAPPSSRRVVSP